MRAEPADRVEASAARHGADVLLITPRFPPECCGVGDYAGRLAEALHRAGESVLVLTQPSPGTRPPGIPVLEHPLRGWRDLASLLRTIAGARPGRVQLEYSSYGWSRWGCAVWVNALLAALRWRGIPVTLALHEFPLRIRQHPLQTGIALLQRLHFSLLALAADDLCTNTPERVRVLRRWLPWRREKIHYRPNSSTIPVDADGEGRREILRARRAASPETFVVATFGSFAAGKNYDAAIEAVGIMRKQLSIQLWLLGNTEAAQPAHLQRLRDAITSRGLESCVFWPGPLPPADLSAHLSAADLFLLPQADGHLTRSSTFMAAAAHGLPVVAVRNSANQLEFEHGRQVWLVPQSTGPEFAAAIAELAAHAGKRSRMGDALRNLYREKFDWNVTVPCDSRRRSPAPAADRPVSEAQTKHLPIKLDGRPETDPQ